MSRLHPRTRKNTPNDHQISGHHERPACRFLCGQFHECRWENEEGGAAPMFSRHRMKSYTRRRPILRVSIRRVRDRPAGACHPSHFHNPAIEIAGKVFRRRTAMFNDPGWRRGKGREGSLMALIHDFLQYDSIRISHLCKPLRKDCKFRRGINDICAIGPEI